MTKHIEITRSVPLHDIEISRTSDGRTVTAYAATFGVPYEVNDHDGHYDEIINRTAFNRVISRGFAGVQVLYNHAMTIWGTPSERFSTPLGTPIKIEADTKGLLTVSRYAKTPLADEILALIEDGAVRSMSFRGRVFRSAPLRGGLNGRPVNERLELGLKEYGPSPFPANDTADIVAIRSQVLADQLSEMNPDDRRALIDLLQAGLPLVDPSTDPDPESQPAGKAPDDPGSSVQLLELAAAQRRRRI